MAPPPRQYSASCPQPTESDFQGSPTAIGEYASPCEPSRATRTGSVYDTQESHCVAMPAIAAFIRKGEEIKVVDGGKAAGRLRLGMAVACRCPTASSKVLSSKPDGMTPDSLTVRTSGRCRMVAPGEWSRRKPASSWSVSRM